MQYEWVGFEPTYLVGMFGTNLSPVRLCIHLLGVVDGVNQLRNKA